jgi:hypothetical protein
MKIKGVKRVGAALAGIVLLGLIGVGVGSRSAYGQSRSARHQNKMAMSGMSMSKKDASGTVFCPGMSTGQLCPMGTVATLDLTGQKRQQWAEAVSKYNKAVGEATQQLLASAKRTLSPAEYAQVKTWFARGLNPEINRLLSSKQASAN